MTKKTIALAALLIAGITAIILLAGSVRSTPEEIIKEMNVNMADLKTVHSETKINIEVTKPEMDVFFMSLVASSDTDKTDPENIRSAEDFDIVLGSEGMQFTLTGKTITIKDTSYLKLITIPALPMIEPSFRMIGVDISDLKKQWIKIDKESIKNIFGDAWTPRVEENFQTNKELEKQMTKEIQNLFLTSNFYAVKQELPEEKIKGETAHHYLVSLQKEETKDLILETFRIIRESQGDAIIPPEEELIEFSQKFGELFDKIGGMEAHLWIGKYDRYLYKFQLNKTIDASEIEEGEEGTVVINMILEFSDFNQSLNITAPEDFKSLEEVFGTPKRQADDGRVIANMRSIYIEAEIIEAETNSYDTVNCNGALAIRTICDDIAEHSVNQEKPTIHQSKNAYCAYIEVSNGYHCIDDNDSYPYNKTVTTYPGRRGWCDGVIFTCPSK